MLCQLTFDRNYKTDLYAYLSSNPSSYPTRGASRCIGRGSLVLCSVVTQLAVANVRPPASLVPMYFFVYVS